MANESQAPRWFTIAGVIFLLWNLMGLVAFYMQVTMTPETIATLPEADQALYEGIPMWVNIVFGISVIGGTLGCILLLMRKAVAVPVFIVSLVSILLQFAHWFLMSDVLAVKGPSSVVMPAVVVVIGIYLVILSRRAKASGWIG